MEERLSPLKSMETSSVSSTPRIPFMSPSAAALNAALTSSAVAGFSSSATKSTTETVGVGTLRAYPSNLPFNSGNTKPTAAAAPVVVGIMLAAACARDNLYAADQDADRLCRVDVVIKPFNAKVVV